MDNLDTKTATMRDTIYLSIIALIIILNYFYFLFFSNTIHSYLYTFTVASLFYFLMILLLFKKDLSRNFILSVTLIVLVFKIISLGILPIGSDDYFRYLWDGKVLANGINPFKFSPDAIELKHLHSILLPGSVTYPDIKTIYFPISQFAFAIAYFVGGESVYGLKIIILISDLLILLAIFLILKEKKINYKFILIYVLSPLIFYQFYIDAHIDILGIMFFAFTFYFYDKNKIISALFLGASLAVKPTLLLAIPIFFLNEKDIKNKLIWLVLPLTLLFLLFIPFFISANPFESFLNFTKHWTFNGLVYNLLSILLDSNFAIRITSLFLFGITYSLIIFFNKKTFSSLYFALFALFLFSPIVHPWYAAWLIVLLVIYPRLSGIAFLSLISITFYTVLIYQTKGIWKEYPIILVLEYLPIVIILIYENRKYLAKGFLKRLY